jgi:hypothetical protein
MTVEFDDKAINNGLFAYTDLEKEIDYCYVFSPTEFREYYFTPIFAEQDLQFAGSIKLKSDSLRYIAVA